MGKLLLLLMTLDRASNLLESAVLETVNLIKFNIKILATRICANRPQSYEKNSINKVIMRNVSQLFLFLVISHFLFSFIFLGNV